MDSTNEANLDASSMVNLYSVGNSQWSCRAATEPTNHLTYAMRRQTTTQLS